MSMDIDEKQNEKETIVSGPVPSMGVYEAISCRRIIRDFQDKVVPPDVLKRIIDAGLKAPTHDHLRNWEFVILHEEQDKKNALQFIKMGTAPQLEILKKTLVDGTAQQKMYAIAMPRQYTMLFNASHIILPFFKSTPGMMHPTSASSFNPISSIWCVIENIFLAATAEGLGCSMRIPVGEEGINVAKTVGAPEEYFLPCYIGLGYPAEDCPAVEQVECNTEQKIHFGKW
ncbi:putative nitroreductase family protein [Monocercomonoides exilis]|uniref:putative nitroreductase family protein n=1 Tax=Monocercomonoides exilis TaxID=2049356 RepID=UPI00355AAFBA|nr:putative nitroreductase family protein [Monocercomonoides exilis]|eukprot:MONOS_4704.1-p1 / transcript=MONOS_4704.1 / gene=MONOS_4704 / organism=Monocercomonoides_exilis_PA203 / gene_product=nitroreductase family protein / transcript_product=nitroreductase family protein / location=Mono_scaffold00128:34222-34908(-) / protein_length=229 / sequence_SO=supercontig / SO=protein_coding / is_pseudo=false